MLRCHVNAMRTVALGALCFGAFAPTTQAQQYPSRPVRLVVSFPQGGPNDILGRLAAGWLSQHLRQPFEVDNKPGNSGNTGTAEVVKAVSATRATM